jgi:hypothetical protein
MATNIAERGEPLPIVQRKGRLLKKLTEGMMVDEKIIVNEPKGRHYVVLYKAKQELVQSGRPVMIRIDPGNRIGIY